MVPFRSLVVSLAALAPLFVACNDITGPGPVVITVAVSPDRMAPGDTAVIVVRFTNTGGRPVDLPLFCQHLFEVANAQGEVVVGREPLYCIAIVVPPVVLGPFQSIERRFTWTGRSPVGAPLPPGLYRVYGKLGDRLSAADILEIEAPVP